jgi:hypothetical protein
VFFWLDARTAGHRQSHPSLKFLHGFFLKRADFAVLPGLVEIGHLHPNRPSEQLSWRTPCDSLVREMSAAADHPPALLRGGPMQGEIRRKAKESPAEPANREPSA